MKAALESIPSRMRIHFDCNEMNANWNEFEYLIRFRTLDFES
jgi:hypothetical protein